MKNYIHAYNDIPDDIKEYNDLLKSRGYPNFTYSADMIERQTMVAAGEMEAFCRKSRWLADVSPELLVSAAADFWSVFWGWPIADNHGGLNFPSGLALFQSHELLILKS